MISREARHYRKYLNGLIVAVENCADVFDEAMRMPSTVERGKRLATIMNHLTMQKDIAKRYGLSPPSP